MFAPLQCESLLWGYPAPLLNFDFANGIYRQDAIGYNSTASNFITTSRASVGYSDDTSGNWTSFLSNVPRITNKGLLVEEARTNSAPNNSMAGAVAGSPGTAPDLWSIAAPTGLVRTITLGTTGGVEWIEFNYAGTATSTSTIRIRQTALASSPAASSGQSWTDSAWISNSSATGITTLLLYVQGLDASNNQSESASVSVLSQAWARAAISRTLTAGTTTKLNHLIDSSSITSGATGVNVTIRIGWPQSELGAFVTSPIRTSTVAVARAADVVTVTTPPAIGTAATLFWKGAPTSSIVSTTNQVGFSINDGTNTNRLSVVRAATTGFARSVNGNGGNSPTTGIVWVQDSSGKLAFANASGNQGISFNGSSAAIGIGAVPPGMNTVSIGSSGGVSQCTGYIERVALWPNTRLSNAILQRITA